MNWKEIKEKYPKAFKEYGELYNGLWWLPQTMEKILNFFDKNGIIIDFYCRPDSMIYSYKIWKKGELLKLAQGNSYNIREKSVSEAFTKAFEILEEKL